MNGIFTSHFNCHEMITSFLGKEVNTMEIILLAVIINLVIFGLYICIMALQRKLKDYLINMIQKEILKYMNDK